MPSPITSYATLVAAVPEWANRNDAEYIAAVPLFIQQTELRMFRHLRCPGNEKTGVFAALTFNNQVGVTIPQDYLEAKMVYYGSRPLERISDQRISEMAYETPDVGTPKYFARVNGSIVFYPQADVNDDVRLIYYESQGPLSATVTWTRMLMISPFAYLYGALAEGARYLRDPAETQLWDQRFQSELDSMNAQAYDNEAAGSTVVVTEIGGGW
ncbi:hypothetical protein UFOVP1008_41 [uncultured Caudovirales phage]|uniref:Uncharacterized protein n=1 Tax=uncultured Caudovirales phage TaxID=2100421 RepID=A0A6J5QXH0_9CAUD|nr:hypothetical protein UFOVP498_49 [uncultured Caudovirales phage]CAB4177737.1 hypothetical protein UFOVP1008_41 [uncultured Caudovirales phage]CAB4187146.1 hypothetical protein UFOVP1160_5 [uncultured Caudovirales phage]CAB4200363.1 hypothetical protein UFOVP1352_45 [uncultured Caudovirales phage]